MNSPPHQEEGEGPGVGDASGGALQPPRQHDEQPLSGNGRDAVERAADAHVERLFVGCEGEHVEAVGCDVMGRGTESHQPEQGERGTEEPVERQRQGNPGERGADEQLHGGNPPAFGLHQVDEGTPEWLDDPGQVEPAGVEGNVGVGDAELLVHHRGDGHHGNVRQGFGEVECGNPAPRSVFRCFHVSSVFQSWCADSSDGGWRRTCSPVRP